MRFESRFSSLHSVDQSTLQFLGVRRAIWTRGYLLVEGVDETRLIEKWFGRQLDAAGIEVLRLDGDRLAGQAFILPLVGQLERPLFVMSDGPTLKNYPTRTDREAKASKDFKKMITKYRNSDLAKKAPFRWHRSKKYDCWMQIPFGHLRNRIEDEWRPSDRAFHSEWKNWGDALKAWDGEGQFKDFIVQQLGIRNTNIGMPWLTEFLKPCSGSCCSQAVDFVRPTDNEWSDFIESIISLTNTHAAGKWFPEV
jgi:hypothetical protein